MPERGLHFYTELVIVTVVSLVAAKAWYRWFVRFLSGYFGTSIHIDFLAAVILTLVAIFGLHLLFSQKITRGEMTLPHGLIYGHESDTENDDAEGGNPYGFRAPRRYLK